MLNKWIKIQEQNSWEYMIRDTVLYQFNGDIQESNLTVFKHIWPIQLLDARSSIFTVHSKMGDKTLLI